MKKLLLCCALWVGATVSSFAQTGNLSGIAYDSISRTPLVGATVVLWDQGQGAINDGLGRFSFSRVLAGNVTLRASYLGDQSFTTGVAVKGNGTAITDFYLLRSTLNLKEVTVASGRDPSRGDIINQIDRQLRTVNSAQDLLPLLVDFPSGSPKASTPVCATGTSIPVPPTKPTAWSQKGIFCWMP